MTSMARTHQKKSLLPHNGARHQLVKPRALGCIAQPGEGSGIANFAAGLLAGLPTAAPHALHHLSVPSHTFGCAAASISLGTLALTTWGSSGCIFS